MQGAGTGQGQLVGKQGRQNVLTHCGQLRWDKLHLQMQQRHGFGLDWNKV